MGKGEVLGAKGGDAGGGEVVNLGADFKTYKLVYWFSSGLKGGREEKEGVGRRAGLRAPKINSSGKIVLNATNKPPKPQPTSATVTRLLNVFFFAPAFPFPSPSSSCPCSCCC